MPNAALSRDENIESYGLSTQFISTSNHDSCVVDALNDLFTKALNQGWSDIHIETNMSDGSLSVRVRVDGLLIPDRHFTRSESHIVMNKIRSRARLSQTDNRSPQDGRFLQNPPGSDRRADVRVSILQTGHDGHSVVMRILDSANAGRTIESLLMPENVRVLFLNHLARNEGSILTTGPTGSGKTTTLYAAFNHLNTPDKKLISVEDPIEYQVQGIQQVQVGVGTGRTFATVLRSVLRQDPEAVLVGEIRDTETVEIAARAAMTGHLVLSTLHANSAMDTVIRLLDMGLPLHVLKAAVNLVIAQRLVRLTCRHCAVQTSIDDVQCRIFADYGVVAPEQLAHGTGCEHCRHTGYQGRQAIFEALELNTDFWKVAMPRSPGRPESAPDDHLMREAAANQPHYRPLAALALQMAAEGKTSFAEALRLVYT